MLRTIETRDGEPVMFDFADHASARQQRDGAAGSGQHAANETTDAARARNDNAPIKSHPEIPPTDSKIADLPVAVACLVTVIARHYGLRGGAPVGRR
jgi:hypothetical protein